MESSQTRDGTHAPCTARWILYHWATSEVLQCMSYVLKLMYSVQFSSAAQSCPTLCNPMNRSTPGLPVHHQLLELTHSRPSSRWCHPALSSSVVPFSSCPQSLPVSESFPMSYMRKPKYWSFSFSTNLSNEHPGLISFRMDLLDLLHSKGLSRVFSNTTVQKHQFFGAQLSSRSNFHIYTWSLKKP